MFRGFLRRASAQGGWHVRGSTTDVKREGGGNFDFYVTLAHMKLDQLNFAARRVCVCECVKICVCVVRR